MRKHFFFFVFVSFFSFTSEALATHEGLIHEFTQSACEGAGGTCATGANCNSVSGSAGIQYDLLGYCDGNTQQRSCCKVKSTSTGPGTDHYCINTQKGTCYNQQEGCKNGGLQVGTCSVIAGINSPRICCSNPTPAGATLSRGAFDYTLLEEIPNSTGTSGDFSSYLQSLYKFTFWAIGIAALFMLTVGGFMYITSAGNTSRIGTAKTIIVDSILGIIIALFAWLFLYVLNPDLVENLSLPTTTGGVGAGGTSTGGTTGGTVSGSVQSLAQQVLAPGSGISLSGSGSCSSASGTVSPRSNIEQAAAGTTITRCQNGCPGTGLCTQTVGISGSMLQAMLEVAKKYPFTVTSIAGGSHCEAGVANCKGLSSHYQGTAIDISTGNKADWPAIVTAFRNAGSNGGQTFCDKGGRPVSCDAADHIHIAF